MKIMVTTMEICRVMWYSKLRDCVFIDRHNDYLFMLSGKTTTLEVCTTMKKSQILPRFIIRISVLLCMALILFGMFLLPALATNGRVEVAGNVYEFGKDSHYEFQENHTPTSSEDCDTYGTFSIRGNIVDVSVCDGVPSYEVSDGTLALFYNYGDATLNADIDSWHLIEDKSKKVADMTLSSNIMKGAIILQTSKDRKTWVDVNTITNAFSDTPIRTGAIYSTSDVELINGCFYRIVVVYETRIRTEDGPFILPDKYDYKKYAEIYEFYAYINTGEPSAIDPNQTYNLGSKVRVENFDGYSGSTTIDKKDAHYGWELGRFFVSGYTDEVENINGDMVFLKNAGDKVTLWFKLNENINALRGNEKLSITADTEGYDQYFETPKMNFGRGVLIIRYTDHNNVQQKPTIYTNYLEANATVGADTKVQLFEEGDYEVALDYEITSDELIDKIGHYRIFFRFSIRNGNCMVYPFDVVTGGELTNSSMTENGFRLDLAMSRYLKVNIKREVLKDSADGLIEDTRFNGPAKDGAKYTDDGIYTITVQNEYTNQLTVKKIYVGTNRVLRAYMTTGLSIPEINLLLTQGATISDDGTIQLTSITPPAEQPGEFEEPVSIPEQPAINEPGPETHQVEDEPDIGFTSSIIIIAGVCTISLGIVVFIVMKKRRTPVLNDNTEDKGGVDQ